MSDYESEGRRFESCRARPSDSCICRSFCGSSVFSFANRSGSVKSVTGVRSAADASRFPNRSSPKASAACL